MQITSMLQQTTFTMRITQLLVRIASMLQQEATFTMNDYATINTNNFNVTAGLSFFNQWLVQQSMRITSMLQQELTFSIGIMQQSMRIIFNVTAFCYRFYNQDRATINADNFNFIAGTVFTMIVQQSMQDDN